MELVYETLKKAIIGGQWKIGERRNIKELSEALNVSRTPVLEASKLLEMEGLLRILPQVGLEVPRLTSEDVEEIFYIRGALSGLATEHACRHLKEKEIEKLGNLVESMDQFVEEEDYEQFSKLNRAFHNCVYKNCKLPHLIMLLERYWHNGNRYAQFFRHLPEARICSAQNHHRILAALKDRDEKKARIEAEKDSVDFGAALSAFLQQNKDLLK